MAVGGVEVRKLERWMSGELRGTKGVEWVECLEVHSNEQGSSNIG